MGIVTARIALHRFRTRTDKIFQTKPTCFHSDLGLLKASPHMRIGLLPGLVGEIA